MTPCQKLVERLASRLLVKTPLIVGITGPMGVGKSTFSESLRDLLKTRFPTKTISIVRTDGFIYPNRELIEKQLLSRKGFPESFDNELYLKFLRVLRKNEHILHVIPSYSQVTKDIDMENSQHIEQSDVYLVEGINLFFLLEQDARADLMLFYDEIFLLTMDPEKVALQNAHRFDMALEHAKKTPTEYFQNLLHASSEEIESYKKKLVDEIHKPFRERYIDPYTSHATAIIPLEHEEPFSGILPYFRPCL